MAAARQQQRPAPLRSLGLGFAGVCIVGVDKKIWVYFVRYSPLASGKRRGCGLLSRKTYTTQMRKRPAIHTGTEAPD